MTTDSNNGVNTCRVFTRFQQWNKHLPGNLEHLRKALCCQVRDMRFSERYP